MAADQPGERPVRLTKKVFAGDRNRLVADGWSRCG
jgi:hypothetical protein